MVTHLRCEYLKNPLGIDEFQPRLSWILESQERGQKQTAYRILVASSLRHLEKDEGDLWDTGRVESDRSIEIIYSGKTLESRQQCYWKVCIWDKNGELSDYSAHGFWTMGLLGDDDWKSSWIKINRPPAAKKPADLAPGPPPPWFRKTFELDRQIKQAFVYVTALGLYELYMNGHRVGVDEFAPEWTDYNIRVHYRTYDVTSLLQKELNCIGAVVGDGWYSGYVGWRKQRGNYGMENGFMLQMEVLYVDGTTAMITTDGSWRCSEGPIISSDLLMGEHYDARKEMPGWDSATFDDMDWKPAVLMEKPKTRLVAQPSEPVQITEYIPAVTVTNPQNNTHVFDLGQNIAGWVRLKVRGEAGTKITLRFAERLNLDGSIYTENLRDARATDVYILKGDGEEVYEPRFTFHGFQYVEVTGFPDEPPLETVTGCMIQSTMPPVGSFHCSDPMVNQLFANLVWGQRGNYLSIPTDCPQRDERLGWMGDAQIFIRTGSYNYDVAAFFTKWMQDVVDAQSKAGAFPDFAPRLNDKQLMGFEAAPAWGDAGIIIPWTQYRVYGDTRIISAHWDAMERWMDFLLKANPNLIRRKKVNNNYGDWLSIKADTPKDLLATAYWAYDAWLMSKMAEVIHRKEDAGRYDTLFRDIRSAFQKAFVSSDGHVKGETQTAYLLALSMDLIPPELRDEAAAHLVDDIRGRDTHLSTGFVGCGFINPVLTEMGYKDIAYQLLLNETFPSWGYSIKHGATTIWERWDGWTEDKGFQDPGMNSFNHYAFGAIGEWLYRFVAGIDLDPGVPGFKKIRIRPYPSDDLEYARAEYQSIHGKIISGWTRQGGEMTMDVTIPPNTTATVFVPFSDVSKINEDGKRVEDSEGVRFLRTEEGRVVFEVESGRYTFVFPIEG